MESLEKEVCSLSKISSEGNHFVEALKEETASKLKYKVHFEYERFIAEEKYSLETSEEKAVPLQVHLWFARVASKKGSCVEMKEEEASLFSKASVLHL